MLISNANQLPSRSHRQAAPGDRAHRAAAPPGGRTGAEPDAGVRAGDHRQARPAHAERAGRSRAHSASDGHTPHRGPRGGGPRRPHARPAGRAILARLAVGRRPPAAGAVAHPQERVPVAPTAHAVARRARDARPRCRDPRAPARGGRGEVSAAFRRSLTSLAVPNYRRYFAGQVISVSGNWMQMVAEMWLIVQLTGSGVSVGITAGLQFVPILLFGAWGGLLADRLPKRRVLMVTQALMALPALTLFALYEWSTVAPWMVYALVLARGSVNAVDNPTRQSFVIELVGPERVVNAVSLNSVIVQSARIIGPATAGAVIALTGVGTCFAFNALSFVAMLIALAGMDSAALRVAPPAERARGELRAALRHVRGAPALWIPLAMMALVGTLSFNFQVLMPLLASKTWHGTALTYALLTAAIAAASGPGAPPPGPRRGAP